MPANPQLRHCSISRYDTARKQRRQYRPAEGTRFVGNGKAVVQFGKTRVYIRHFETVANDKPVGQHTADYPVKRSGNIDNATVRLYDASDDFTAGNRVADIVYNAQRTCRRCMDNSQGALSADKPGNAGVGKRRSSINQSR